MVKRLDMSIFNTSGLNVKNVNILHICIKGEKCQYYIQAVRSLTMSILYTIG